MIEGASAFFKTIAFLLLLVEASLLLEEFCKTRMSFRKGFSGTNTSMIKGLQRHFLKTLTLEGTIPQSLLWSVGIVFVITSAGLLPSWGGTPALTCPHSFWIYLTAKIALPIIVLVFEWTLNKGRGWPSLLVTAERAVGSATVLFIMGLTLIEMTGADNFIDLRNIQSQHTWLIIRFPFAAVLMFGFITINLFMTSQTLFGQYLTGEKQEGWNLSEFTPHLARASWSLFIVDVFLGGGNTVPVASNILLLSKCVLVLVLSTVLSNLFLRLREDQAENFVVWKLAPLSVAVLALSLIFSGGRL